MPYLIGAVGLAIGVDRVDQRDAERRLEDGDVLRLSPGGFQICG